MKWRWLVVVLLILVLVVLACLAVISFVLLPELDSKLASAVRRELSLPEDAEVEIERGSFAQTLDGYLPRCHLKSSDVTIDNLQVEQLVFTATGIGFNMREMIKGEKTQITEVQSAELSLQVSAGQLESRLIPLLEQEGLSDVQLSFDSTGVKMTAKRKFKVVGTVKLGAKGQFIAGGSDHVRFKVTDVEIADLDIGVSKLNLDFGETIPALDLGGMFAEIIIDELYTTEGYLHIKAHTESILDGSAVEDAVEVL